MNVSLVMFNSDGERRDFPVEKDRIVVGRKNTCDLRIPLSSVSRQHCELRVEDEQVHLRDLGSSNGTFHNSVRVQETTLLPGDEIVIGPVVFTVVVDGKPKNIEPVRTLVDDEATPEASGPGEDSPQEIVSASRDDDDLNLEDFEPEAHSPTTDFDDDGDDDPIQALERLAGNDDSAA